MRKRALLFASMTSGVLLACLAAVLTAAPGVLRLNLRADSYAWKFVPIAN